MSTLKRQKRSAYEALLKLAELSGSDPPANCKSSIYWKDFMKRVELVNYLFVHKLGIFLITQSE